MDLRKEFNDLLSTFEGVGRWVLVRHMTGERSEYWKPETREAVGGPAYTYTDTLVEAYSAPVITRSVITTQGVEYMMPGAFDEDYIKFFVKHDVVVAMNDEIFELDYHEKNPPTVVFEGDVDASRGQVKPKVRYKVQKVDDMRCAGGRVEYKVVYGYKTVAR